MRKNSLGLTIFGLLLFICEIGLAKGKKSYGLGISIFDQAVIKGEMNFSFGSLALEIIGRGGKDGMENLGKSDSEKKRGDSLLVSEGEIALFYYRYGNSKNMSGFFWGAGAGFRNLEAKWRKNSEEGTPVLVTGSSEEQGSDITHQIVSSGVAGHVRGGYRYVASSLPLSIGIYAGLRYFDNKVEKNAKKPGLDLTDDEKKWLSKRFQNSFEPGLELSFVF